MIAWLSFALPVLAVLGIIVALGLPIALALRVRGFAVAIVTIPAAFAIIALSSIIAYTFGISWSLVPPLVLTVLISVVLFLLRSWIGRPTGATARPHRFWLPVASAAIGGAIIAATLWRAMGSPDAILQVHDAIFQYNLLRYDLDSGVAPGLQQDLLTPGDPQFYPMLWHAFALLVIRLTGAEIPFATNALTFVIVAVVWPVGAVALARAVAGPSTRVTLLAGVLLAVPSKFPLFMLHLAPNQMAVALAPFVMVAVLQLLNMGRSRSADPLRPTARWLLLLGGLGAVTLAHPNVLNALIIWSLFPVVWCTIRQYQGKKTLVISEELTQRPSRSPYRVVLPSLGLLAFLVVGALFWFFTQTGFPYVGEMRAAGAIINVLGSVHRAAGGAPPWHLWYLSLLTLVGIVTIWRRRSQNWLIGAGAALAITYVVSAFGGSHFLTSPWYNSPSRLAAFIVFVGFPVSVLGAAYMTSIATTGYSRFLSISTSPVKATLRRLRRQFPLIIAVLMLIAIILGSFIPISDRLDDMYYRSAGDSNLLSPNERKLLSRLSEHVPEGEILLSNPWSGGSLAYALEGYPVLFPHSSPLPSAQMTAMLQALKDGEPEACPLVTEFNVHYVLDFGSRIVKKDHPKAVPFSPIADLKGSALLTELDREGKHAVLYEITGCD